MLNIQSRMRGLLLRLSCLLFSLFFGLFTSFTQITISIVDQNTSEPLENVEVFSEDWDSPYLSNVEGKISIDTFIVKIYNFALIGYNTESRDLSEILENDNIVVLSELSTVLNELILIGQNSFKESDQYHQLKRISSKEIAFTNPQTSADMLAHHGGVYVQKSQMGGGSPIIRGFEANRILMVVDGVRLNNAIYRSGHLQNAITIDASAIQETNVLFGPNSLAYGSDALGGVISFKTKIPKLSSDDKIKTRLNAFMRYASSNMEKTVHADLSLGWKNFGLLTNVTFTDYGDLRTGSKRDNRFPDFGLRPTYASTSGAGVDSEIINPNPNTQIGTAYHQVNLLQKLVYRPNEHIFLSGNFQYSVTGDVPRYDNLQEIRNGKLRYAEWNYGPQERILASFQIKNYLPQKIYDQFIITAAYQFIQEDRIIRNFGNDNRLNQNEDVHVGSLSLEFKKGLLDTPALQLLYGFDIQQNNVVSSAFNQSITSQTIASDALSRYADADNKYLTYGVFTELELAPIRSQLSYKAGLRYSGSSYKIKYLENELVDWPISFLNGISNANASMTWSVSGLYSGKDGLFFRALTSSAFRSPNIDDLSKIRVNSDQITFPNPDLSPEKSISSEVSVGIAKEKLNISATGFYTSLHDAISTLPFTTPSGESSFENYGETLIVVANQNVQKAKIYGLSLNATLQMHEHMKLSSSINFTKGIEKIDGEDDQPFAHIPPMYGKTSFSYNSNKWNLQFSAMYNGMKDITSFGGSVDNPDLATPIGSLPWTTFNFYSQYQISSLYTLSLAVENLLDKHYRPFSSGVSAPGRNIILSFRVNL